MKPKYLFLVLMLAAFAAVPAPAKDRVMPPLKVTPGVDTPASRGYMTAMEKMHKGMAITYTGDADVDFVRGMIPHHQGAVDMCKVELHYGKDAEIRKLCDNIISSQQAQISEMKNWLRAHGK